jgi:hypothetical protein
VPISENAIPLPLISDTTPFNTRKDLSRGKEWWEVGLRNEKNILSKIYRKYLPTYVYEWEK